MTSAAKSPEEYMDSLPDDRKHAMNQLRETIVKNLPKGFTETMSYGMLCYCVPHSKYPAGYHCNPTQPLPFVSVASQKKFHCPLPHGSVFYAGTVEMVHRRISKA